MADYTYDEIISALKKADAAGDTEAATKLAEMADKLKPLPAEAEGGAVELTPDPERMSPERAAGKQITGATVLEQMFGKGPQPGMDIGQRLERIGEAGVGGMAVGGAIGGGVGALAGGVGGVPGMAAGATIGGISGVLGEIGEQISAEYGGSRLEQLLTGLVAGAPSGEVGRMGTTALKAGGNITLEAIKALVKPGQALSKIGNLLSPEASTATADARRLAVEAARKEFTQGETAGKVTALAGEEIQQGVKQQQVAEQQKLLERQRRAAELAARAEKGKAGEITALRRQQELADQELQLVKEKGAGPTKDPYDFGTDLRDAVVGVKDPIELAAKTEYKTSKTAALDVANKNEANGVFWGKEEGAQAIKKKWKTIASKSSEDVKAGIDKVINDIWKKKAVRNEAGEITGYKDSYLSAEGIDQIVRKLGDVGYGAETEGYKALGAAIARELRSDITKGLEKEGARSGGFYDWSGLGPAKGKYAESLENLEKFKTARGAAATGEKAVDVEALPKRLLGSRSGFTELSGILPKEKVSEYAQQYARNELAGKNVDGIRKWASEHEYLGPEIKAIAEQQMNRLSSIENKSLVLKERLSQAGEKTWSANVDKIAQKWATEANAKINQIAAEAGVEGKAGLQKDANVIIADMLSGKYTGSQLKAVSKYFNDNTGSRNLFPYAVSDYLSKVSPANLTTEFTRIKPALEGSGLVGTAEMAYLEAGVNSIVEASRKLPSLKKGMPAEIKKLFRSSFAVKTGAGGQVGAEQLKRISDEQE